MLYEELTRIAIGSAMEVHRLLGPGFLESVYEHAMALELNEKQIPFERQRPITITYKQVEIGKYRADFLVDNKVILEIKAATSLIPEHHAQVLHYLTATGLRLALLLNFGAKSLQFRRVIK